LGWVPQPTKSLDFVLYFPTAGQKGLDVRTSSERPVVAKPALGPLGPGALAAGALATEQALGSLDTGPKAPGEVFTSRAFLSQPQ
jgi:hypothetical protein